MRIVTFNTMPSKKDHFWQMVTIPTITVLNSVDPEQKYIALNFEWLFWSVSFIFENGSKR